MSSAFARPCSLNWAPATRLRPRQSKESKFSMVASSEPRATTRAVRSSRTQVTIASAVSQRSVAGGAIAIGTRFRATTRSNETMSGPPHSPGPEISPSGLKTARSGVRRSWQAVGAVAGLSPRSLGASSALSSAGRGRGKGIDRAAAPSLIKMPIAITANPSFTSSASANIAVFSRWAAGRDG